MRLPNLFDIEIVQGVAHPAERIVRKAGNAGRAKFEGMVTAQIFVDTQVHTQCFRFGWREPKPSARSVAPHRTSSEDPIPSLPPHLLDHPHQYIEQGHLLSW